MKVEIRPATFADLQQFYDTNPGDTVRAVSVFADGELAAVAGVRIERGRLTAFSDIKEGITAPKITIWRTAKELMKHVTKTNAPLLAVCEDERACRFLERLGWKHLKSDDCGEVYQWQR